MGGSGNLLMPVPATSFASFSSHTRRNPPSTEPGTDMFVPIGTPVIAPADGRVYGYGDTIGPMTGRWVGLDFDNGMRFRCMHHSRLSLSRTVLNNKGYVRGGTTIALSGASGYGYEDWSKLSTMPDAHTHVTLWESNDLPHYYGYRPNGKPWSIDFMQHVANGSAAGGGAKTTFEGDNEMRGIYNTQNSNEETRRALVGELSFQVVSRYYSLTSDGTAGPIVNVNNEQWDNHKRLVNLRRVSAGMKPL